MLSCQPNLLKGYANKRHQHPLSYHFFHQIISSGRDEKSAQQMARDLKQYLQHHDKLFHCVRDEHGMLHLMKRAAEYQRQFQEIG